MARYHLTIPDRLDGILKSLVEDCDLTPSQIFAQLLARHSADIRAKFTLDCAELGTEVQNSTQLYKTAQDCTASHITANTVGPIAQIEPLQVQSQTDEGFDFASMIANS